MATHLCCATHGLRLTVAVSLTASLPSQLHHTSASIPRVLDTIKGSKCHVFSSPFSRVAQDADLSSARNLVVRHSGGGFGWVGKGSLPTINVNVTTFVEIGSRLG